MPYLVRVSTLFVGQGQCNVVEVYHGADATNAHQNGVPQFGAGYPAENLAFSAILDFGSHNAGVLANSHYARQYLRNMVARRGGNMIDYVSVSHGDTDHWNQLEFIPARGPVTITNYFISGIVRNIGNYIFNNQHIINFDYFYTGTTPFMDDPYEQIANNSVQYVLPHNRTLRFTVLKCLGSQQALGYSINTGSIVTLMTIINNGVGAEFSALFMGDATAQTLYGFNYTGAGNDVYEFSNEMKFIMIPHHGSMTTIETSGRIANRAPLDHLLAGLNGVNQACVSACIRFQHPRGEVFDIFYRGLAAQVAPPHQVLLHDGAAYAIYNYNRHIYTTYKENDVNDVPNANGGFILPVASNIHIEHYNDGAAAPTTNLYRREYIL